MALKLFRSHKLIRFLAYLLASSMLFASSGPAIADDCLDLAEIPLLLLGGGPPPIFMVFMDSSDSMGYEVMTGNSAIGQGALSNPCGGDPIPYIYTTGNMNANSLTIENQCIGA